MASSLLIIIGLLVITDGITMGENITIQDGSSTITVTPETLTVADSRVAEFIGYGSFYGGWFFLGAIFIIGIMWFKNELKKKGYLNTT